MSIVLVGLLLARPVEAPPAEDRRAACLARNADAPVRYRPVIAALCADHHNLGGVGASVAIAEGGRLRYVATAGQRCVGGPAVEVDTGFRIGSLTKLWTAALVVSAVDRGVWDLDEAVVRALPELAAAVDARAATISLRQLLSHTAGLGELWPRDAPTGADEWMTALLERPLGTRPGELWSYSNVGYALVGLALERSLGEPYAALLDRHVLGPLAAVHVTADPQVALRDGAACGHLGRGAQVLALDVQGDLELGARGARWSAPAGGMVASSGALAEMVLGLFDPLRSPLSAAGREALLQPQVRTHERPGEHYALGLRVQVLADGRRLYAHAGATGDFAAELYFMPERGFALVLLRNTGDLLQSTAGVALQTLLGVTPARPAAMGDPSAYVGRFAVEDADAIAVTEIGDGLRLTRGTADFVLEPIGDHRFRARGLAGVWWTFVFADGPAHASHLRGPEMVAVSEQE